VTRLLRHRIRKIDLLFALVAPLLGILAALSTDRWCEGMEAGAQELRKSKEDLVRSAGLLDLHYRIYSRVGERAWENEVKPDFLMAITYATANSTGNPLPESRDVVEWVRANPSRARHLLEAAERAHLLRVGLLPP
jgi:hypothetical protein